MLIGQFLGTSDAAGIPSPYCECDVCNEARTNGGKSRRMRSCFRLTDKIIIDLGADAVCQSAIYGSFSQVEHVLITHTHDDHLNAHMLSECIWVKTEKLRRNYYFTDKAYEITEHWRSSKWMLKGGVEAMEKSGLVSFNRLEYGMPYHVDDVTVTPFRGNHRGNVQENSAMYLIELPDGRSLFYGLDSGPYLEETLDALRGHHVDIFISEATGGTATAEGEGRQHMYLSDVYSLTETLLRQKTISYDTKFYLTHINHSTSHSQMEEAVEKMHFPIETTVAYDGLKIL